MIIISCSLSSSYDTDFDQISYESICMLWSLYNTKLLCLVHRTTQESDPALDWNKPCKKEIKKAIMCLSDGNAAGPDGVPAGAKKADVNTSRTLRARCTNQEEAVSTGHKNRPRTFALVLL